MSSDRRATRANYDRLSRWYDFISGSSERPARTRGLQMLDIQCGERVLEIGCGTGEALTVLASRAGDAGGVIALDLSAGMLYVAKEKLARHNVPAADFIQGDGTRLPFAKETFDAVFLSFTLELFPGVEIPALLRECRRVLRREGRIGVVSLLQSNSPGWMEKTYTWAHHHWPDVIDCRPILLINILEDAGFTVTKVNEQSMWGLKVGIALAYSK